MTDSDQYFTWQIRINILHDRFGSIFYMTDSDLYFNMTDSDLYFTWQIRIYILTWQIRINILHDRFGSIFYMTDSDLYFTWQIRIYILTWQIRIYILPDWSKIRIKMEWIANADFDTYISVENILQAANFEPKPLFEPPK